MERIEVVENRVTALERQIEWMTHRLASLEYWRAGKVYQAPPPPQAAPTPPTPEPPPVAEPPRAASHAPDMRDKAFQAWATRTATSPPQPKRDNGDVEYLIGARLLPRVGALLLLGAIVYLTYLGLESGWITPTMVFIGEILFCLGFVAAGQWKRGEAEQYGQVLTGVGSCGLYIALAGGHLVQNLYSGQVLVAAAMTLSFANLAYALWTGSRSFLGIGIVGGLATALLPMNENNTSVNALLHLMIVLPAALVAARKKWWDMAGWLWLLSSMAVVPLLASKAPWMLQTATLYLGCGAAVAAYSYAYRKNTFDPQAVLGAAMMFATGIAGLAVQHQPIGAVHLIVLGVFSWLVSLVCSEGDCRSRLQAVAVLIPAVLAPMAFAPPTCAATFTGLSLLAGIWAIVAKSKFGSALGGLELLLALIAYLIAQDAHLLALSTEAALLLGLMAAAVVSALGVVRAGGHKEVSTLLAMGLLFPLFTRLGVVALGGSAMAPTPFVAAAQAMAIFTLAAVLLAARTRWISAFVAVWIAFGIALFGYAAAALQASPPGHDLFLLVLLLGGCTGALAVGEKAIQADSKRAVSFATGVLVGLLSVRFVYVLAQILWPGFDPILVVSLTAAGCSLLASGTSRVRQGGAALAVAWSMFAISGFAYFYGGFHTRTIASEMAVVCGLLASFVAASAATTGQARKHPEIWHVIAMLGWAVFSRWVDVTLTWGSAELHSFSTLTVAWIVYALSLLTLGISMRVRELRYWSFGVMFVTVTKILLVDLASTSIGFRVGVLVGLGLLMLGGGYWYVRGKGMTPAGR